MDDSEEEQLRRLCLGERLSERKKKPKKKVNEAPREYNPKVINYPFGFDPRFVPEDDEKP